jgi:cob(I)alamin adenosyltransferase
VTFDEAIAAIEQANEEVPTADVRTELQSIEASLQEIERS